MTFKKNDRVKYADQGVKPRLRGLSGTVKDTTRAGWIIVDFDNGYAGVMCAAINLEKPNPRGHRGRS
jgi:hypothetical protein